MIVYGVCLTQKRMNNFFKTATHWEFSTGSWGFHWLLLVWRANNWIFAVLTLLVQEVRCTVSIVATTNIFGIFCSRNAITWRGCNNLLELWESMLMLSDLLRVYTLSIDRSCYDWLDTGSYWLISLVKAGLVELRWPLAPSYHFIETTTFEINTRVLLSQGVCFFCWLGISSWLNTFYESWFIFYVR